MITLSSDFGSPYPAAMRGVMLQETDARLVDVSHEFPRQNVQTSAFWLTQTLPYYPPAVHLVVVDPGVGTDRDAIVVRADEHALVGPDNGVLLPVVRELAQEFEVFEVVEQEVEDLETDNGTRQVPWPPDPASSTFHGRDVFAPAAARVHEAGIDSFEDDPGFEPTDEYEDLTVPDPAIEDKAATATVLAVDDFGNAITNIPGDVIEDVMGSDIEVNGSTTPVRHTYAAVPSGQRLVTVGSHDNVELATNQGRGDDAFDVSLRDSVTLTW
jgi:S-adenosylmethionine hydrolase